MSIKSNTHDHDLTDVQMTWSKLFWRRFRRRPLSMIALGILLFMYTIMIFAPYVAPYSPSEMGVGPAHATPSREHLMGTDHLGRDMFSRVVHASRISLNIGLLVVSASVTIGTVVGAVSGYFGGWTDEILMRFTEVVLTFPFLFLAIVVVTLLSPSFWNIVGILAVLTWPGIARIVRGQFLSLRERTFTEAARALGVPTPRIIFRHILPNTIAPIIVNATLGVAAAILAESGLSYLGLGVQPPDTSWGLLLSQGKAHMSLNIWYTFFPGLMIFITVLCINFLGDGLRDALDPKSAN